MISAGDLDRSITLLTVGSSQDAFGQPLEATTTLATVRAQRAVLRIADVQRGQAQASVAEVKYIIRYRAGVTTALKVVADGITYSVISVDEIGRKDALAILCKAAV